MSLTDDIKKHYMPLYKLLDDNKYKFAGDNELWNVYKVCLRYAKNKAEIGVNIQSDIAKWPLRKFKPFKKALSKIVKADYKKRYTKMTIDILCDVLSGKKTMYDDYEFVKRLKLAYDKD